MTEPRFDKLTDRERAILRLVPECRNSSEIGRITGDAPTTVDKLIKSARAKLDAPDRFGAARLLLAHEAGGLVFGPQSQDLSQPRFPRLALPIPTRGRPTNDLTIRARLLSIVGVAFLIGFGAVGILAVSTTIHGIFGQAARQLDLLLH